jgi:hypothetical protein
MSSVDYHHAAWRWARPDLCPRHARAAAEGGGGGRSRLGSATRYQRDALSRVHTAPAAHAWAVATCGPGSGLLGWAAGVAVTHTETAVWGAVGCAASAGACGRAPGAAGARAA